MSRKRRFLFGVLMVLSLGFLMGDDCEFEIEDWPGFYVYEPYDYVVVEPPIYYYEPCYDFCY